MSFGSGIIQERRRFSRVPAQLACVCTYQGVIRPATLIDLSLGGALLSSKYLPPKGSAVTISLETPQLKKPLTLAGTVARGLRGGSHEQGDVSRFGVQFKGASPQLITLLQALIPKGEDRAASEPASSRYHAQRKHGTCDSDSGDPGCATVSATAPGLGVIAALYPRACFAHPGVSEASARVQGIKIKGAP